METVHKEAFRFHPHSGIATVTTIFQGDTDYEDSTGKKGLLNAGGVEWMKAGNGVSHTAAPTSGGRVGLPYAAQGQMRVDEITGGSRYGVTTIAGGDGSRQPSANELELARFQGRHVAEITSRLAR